MKNEFSKRERPTLPEPERVEWPLGPNTTEVIVGRLAKPTILLFQLFVIDQLVIGKKLRVKNADEIGENFFGMNDASFPGIVAAILIYSFGIVEYTAVLEGLEIDEPFVEREQR